MIVYRLCSKQDEFHDEYAAETNISNIHQKEELDAAEALTFLAGNFKSRWVKWILIHESACDWALSWASFVFV